jgi:hypothetical protein
MSYEELIKDTAEMTKRMQLKWDLISAVLIILCAGLLIVGIRLILEECKEQKEKKLQAVYTGYQFQPVVTEMVQVRDGVEYHRMGPARRIPE